MAKIWVIQNQFGRRNLGLYQRSVLALKLEEIFAKKAKDNQRKHGGTAPGKSLPQNSAEVKIDTSEELAKVANVSHDTIARVKRIEETATPEQKESLRQQKSSINELYKTVRVKDTLQG